MTMTFPPNQHRDSRNDGQSSLPATGHLSLRASDTEREAAADALRDHCAQGRLSPDELSERLDLVYAAKTAGALEALFHDLPAPTGELTQSRRRGALHPPVRAAALAAVPALVALVALSAATDIHLLWLAWPVFAVAGGRRRFGRRLITR
jgi:uncharacterized protein DUF1707